jgi:hypothetical protein
MSAAFWAGLFVLRDAVDQLVLSAGRRLADRRRSAEPETPVSLEILESLHLDVRQELESWSALRLVPASESFGVHADSARCLRLVAFWVNERVCSRLDQADLGDFAPVGPTGVELSAGGVLFFDELEALEVERLRASSAFSSPQRSAALELTADLALFLLEYGFLGVHLGSAARLEPIKARLRRRQLLAVPESPVYQELERRMHFGRWALLLGLVVGFYACCVWLSAELGGG